MRNYLLALIFWLLPFAAFAQVFNTTLPYNLQNGKTADASQVMANLTQMINNGNANAATNGANSNITSLSGLLGGSATAPSVGFSGATGTGLYLSGSSACMATAGAQAWCVDTSGDLSTTGNITAAGTLTGASLTVNGDANVQVPVGAVMAFNLSSCPSGWHVADGTSSTVDLRGYFVRGYNNGTTHDPANPSLGTYEADQVGPVTGTGTVNLNLATSGGSSTSYSGNGAYNNNNNYTVSWSCTNCQAETRPKAVVLLYCEKM